jgi:hypothetical protein
MDRYLALMSHYLWQFPFQSCKKNGNKKIDYRKKSRLRLISMFRSIYTEATFGFNPDSGNSTIKDKKQVQQDLEKRNPSQVFPRQLYHNRHPVETSPSNRQKSQLRFTGFQVEIPISQLQLQL